MDAFDIEDLLKLSKDLNMCPFMHNYAEHSKADLVLMPYNYLLSSRLRSQMKLSLKNKVIIVDEAHNISEAAEENVEMELTVPYLRDIV